jgi:amidophosphoribosyltransferase
LENEGKPIYGGEIIMSGMFGVVAQNDCVQDLFYGIDYHTHLGTEFAGMAVLGNGFIRQIHNVSQSQFKSKFAEDYKLFKGNKGIGVISSIDEQPIYLHSKFGELCIVTDGFIENAEELTNELMGKGISFTEMSQRGVNLTELIIKLINQGDDLIDGIQKMFRAIDGSTSLLILNGDGIYAARDRFGYTPLTIGRKNDDWAVTTESSAFINNDFVIEKHLEPGEIILLSEKGLQQITARNKIKQICSFMWIYTGFPASTFDGVSVEQVRERCGGFLAKRDSDIEIDLVSGVPDSGIAHAIGYAVESGKPYRRPLIKYTPGYGRSYTPPSQETRDLVAKMKLIPVKKIIEGKRIVVCDDSIVRGTQLKNFTVKKLWDNGAREVHVRIACPPLMFPCKFIFSTRRIDELAARRAIRDLEGYELKDVSEYIDHTTEKYQRMVAVIAKEMGVTTLRYQTVDDMVSAIGLLREDLCTYCWTGKHP